MIIGVRRYWRNFKYFPLLCFCILLLGTVSCTTTDSIGEKGDYPSHLFFAVDTTKSMLGPFSAQTNRLDRAIETIEKIVQTAPTNVTVHVLSFDSNVVKEKEFPLADVKSQAEARTFMQSLEADGSDFDLSNSLCELVTSIESSKFRDGKVAVVVFTDGFLQRGKQLQTLAKHIDDLEPIVIEPFIIKSFGMSYPSSIRNIATKAGVTCTTVPDGEQVQLNFLPGDN